MISRTSDTSYESRFAQNGATIAYFGRGVNATGAVTVDHSANTWEHWVVTYDTSVDNKLRVYFNNGTPKTSTGNTDDMGAASLLRLGWGYRVEATKNSKFKGYLNACYVYNRGITADEVSQLYNGGTGV